MSTARACFRDPRVVHLEDEGIVIDGVHFWGSPWQPAFGGWAFNLPRGEALREKWALIPRGTDVLVTHGPPFGRGDRASMVGREGCMDLLARVREIAPRVHFFGHIHEDGGAWIDEDVAYVNCTTWECTRGASVVDIDVATGERVLVDIQPSGNVYR